MYVNRLELGDIPATGPLRQHYLHRAGCGAVFKLPSPSPSRPRIIAFLVGSLFGILRTVPNRFLSGIGTCYVELFRNVPLIVQFFTPVHRWCRSSCRKISACGLNRSWTQTFNSLSPPCCASGLFTAARVCEQVRAAIQSLPRGQKNAGLGDGPDPAANLPLRAAAERLPRYCAADDLGDDELVKNSAIASTIGLADMAAQAGKLLDYSAHASGVFYRHHPRPMFSSTR